MTEKKVDPEQLAALLDGRLNARDRGDLLRRLVDSDDDLEAFLDAAAVLGDSSAPVPETVSPGPRGGHVIRWSRSSWFALAAALTGIAVWTTLELRKSAAGEGDPAHLVASLDASGGGVPAGFETSPWEATRGSGPALSPEARAVRLGARLVDLEVSLDANDGRAPTVGASIASLLDDTRLPGAAPLSAFYRQAGARSANASIARQRALLSGRGAEVERLAGKDGVRLGAWIEAARIAAARRDESFFSARGAGEVLASGERLYPEGDARAGVLAGIREQLTTTQGRDWDSLERQLTAALTALGG